MAYAGKTKYELLMEALTTSTAHGISRVAITKAGPLKAMWAILFAVFLGLFLNTARGLVKKLQSVELTSTYEAGRVSFVFPELYFCPNSQYSGSYPFSLSSAEAKAVNDEVARLSSLYDSQTNDSDVLLKASAIQNSLPVGMAIRYLALRKLQSVLRSELVSHFRVDQVAMEEFYHPTNLICFRPVLTPKLRQHMQTSGSVLHVWLSTDPYFSDFNYTGESIRPIKDRLGNESLEFTEWQHAGGAEDLKISGYTMMLVPPGEYPMVAPSSSFLVAPGNGYSVALEMEESAASEELHGNECVPGSPDVLYRDHLTERPLEFHYNHLTCFHRHKHELFINAFGCQPSGYPLFWEHRAWPRCLNLSEASSAVLTRLRSASLEETTQIDKQASASCSKRIPCHSRSYRAVFSFGRWPGVGSSTIGYFAKEHQAVSEAEAPARWRLTRMARQLLQPGGHSAHLESLFRSYVAESHLRVSVWGSSARSPLVVLSASYSWTAFLADTGGLLGLYIGCSLLTLCELLDLFYMLLEGRLLCATKKCKRRNGQDSAAADEGREPTSAVAV